MKRNAQIVLILSACACLQVMVTSAQDIRAAGELFVHLDATNVTGLSDGAYVATWPNHGTLKDFVPAFPGQGATYVSQLAGAAALQFDGTVTSTMVQDGHTNNASAGGVPLSILGTNVWSAELWFNNAAGGAIETLLTWTSRRSAGNRQLMEIRHYNTTDAVEHYARNMTWSSQAPCFGQWQHLAVTRDALGMQRLYVNARLVSTVDMGGSYMLNLKPNHALFAIGSVDAWGGWEKPLSAAVAVVRVHDGTLSPEDVLHNFMVERSRFGGGWNNPGTGDWNEPTNWENGVIPYQDAPLYINNGGTATYDGTPYENATQTAMLYGIEGGLTVADGIFHALPLIMNDGLLRLGIAPGKTFTLGAVSGGSFTTLGKSLMLGDIAGATGSVSLASAGRLTVARIQKGAGTALLTVDGGVLEATTSANNFLQGLTRAKVKANGICFDVPDQTAITVPQNLLTDPDSPGGGLTKTGPGTLSLTGVNTLTGALQVTGGELVIQNNAFATNYASPITLANDGVIGWNQDGGAASIASNLTAGSVGTLKLYVPNAAENIDFSALPGMQLVTSGSFNYTGVFTPYANRFVFRPDKGVMVFPQTIANLPDLPGCVEVRGTASGYVDLTADNSYTGGTEIVSGGVIVSHANALGLGNDGVRDILCASGTVMRVQTLLSDPSFFSRVQAEPYAALQLSGAGLNQDIDLSDCPNLFTGSENITSRSYFNGVLTPYGNTYLLGNSGVDAATYYMGNGFVITNLTDGPGGEPRAVLVSGIGAVDTRNQAAYSGGTRIENGARLIVTGDGGLGAVPATDDPDNIVIDGGILRTANPFISFAPTRGFTIGPKGAVFHAPGPLPAQLIIPGNLTGSGTMRMTDMGWVTFTGTNNSYQGRVQLEGMVGAMMIGDGTNFSWTSTGGIVGTGTYGWLYLNNSGENTFGDAFSGKGLLTKKGTGTITLTAAQSNRKLPVNTVIESGALRYGLANALSFGTADAGAVQINTGATLDLNGFSSALNGLAGTGCVTNRAGTAVTLQVGAADAASQFDGQFAPGVTLEKIGTNTLLLTHAEPSRQNVSVAAGTLALYPGVALTNGITLTSDAAVRAASHRGLRAEYYDAVMPQGVPAIWPALGTTVEAVEELLSGRTPSLVTDCASFGDFFDSGEQGTAFPGKYNQHSENYFVARYTGVFTAEEAGTYEFSLFADDGCMLFLDNTLVVNNRTGKGTATGSITLEQRDYAILLFFYESAYSATLQLQMRGPSDAALSMLPQRLLKPASPAVIGGILAAEGGRFEADSFGHLVLTDDGDYSAAGFGGPGITNAVIEKQGAGALTLTGTSSFRGTALLSEGDIILANGTSHSNAFDVLNGTLTLSGGTSIDDAPVWIGSLNVAASGELALASKTFLRIYQDEAGIFAGTLSGGTADSVIAKDGPAELVLASDCSAYPGFWQVLAGDLVITDNDALAADTVVTLERDGCLVFRCDGDVSFAGTVTGPGTIRNDGPGTLTLTGLTTSGIEVPAGQTVILDGGEGDTSRELESDIVNNGTLRIAYPGGVLLGNPVSGTGTVSVASNTVVTVLRAGLLADDASLRLDGGTLTLHSGGTLGFNETAWQTNGVSRFVTNETGDVILEANPNVKSTVGSAFHKLRIPATNAWELNAVWRQGAGGGCGGGDGFAIMLQNDARGASALGSSGSIGISTITPSFGYRFYLLSKKFAWVENGSAVGEFVTNLFSWGGGVFTADMAFDGNQLTVTMSQGTKTLTVTNTNARAKLAAVGADAYVGLGSATGGCWGQQFIDSFSFSSLWEPGYLFTNDLTLAANSASTIQAAARAVEGLPLEIGDLIFENGSALTAVPSADSDPDLVFARFGNLTVRGASACHIDDAGWAAFRGTTWTFVPGAVLTVTGTVTLPETVLVAIEGEIPQGRTDLANFRGADIMNAESVNFVLENDDGKTFLIFRDGILYVSRIQGSVLFLR